MDREERSEDLLPGRDGHAGVTATDRRLWIEAVLHRYRILYKFFKQLSPDFLDLLWFRNFPLRGCI